ncbi:psbP domain-containing protein 3, chloroplastic [Senna tora]|uniref:PsbP domain-containing protein 3, chloroplastic n=1 Tax=Senna tora TaxID=362788 RepID=A0A834TWP6_9FABA|nr:psbP domain-containing protein 3, chloroplastic [Senna tora]
MASISGFSCWYRRPSLCHLRACSEEKALFYYKAIHQDQIQTPDSFSSVQHPYANRRQLILHSALTAFTFPLNAIAVSDSEGQARSRIYTDDINKFQIVIPQEWQVGTGEPNGFKSVTAFYPEEESSSNVSVVITGLGPDFTRMESFGKVEEFADTLVSGLDRSWQRPPGVAAKLIDCKAANGFYYIEYSLQNPGDTRRHLYSAIGMASNGWYNRLYTVTGQKPIPAPTDPTPLPLDLSASSTRGNGESLTTVSVEYKDHSNAACCDWYIEIDTEKKRVKLVARICAQQTLDNIKQLTLHTNEGQRRGGRGLPSEAKLQFALLPSITGVGSAHALLAASGSRKVTYTLHASQNRNQVILRVVYCNYLGNFCNLRTFYNLFPFPSSFYGKSGHMFMKTWAYLCQTQLETKSSSSLIQKPEPFFGREAIADLNSANLDTAYTNLWLQMDPTLNENNKPSLKISDHMFQPILDQSIRATLELRRGDLDKIKTRILEKGEEEEEEENQNPPRLSTFVLTTAYVSSCVVKAFERTEMKRETFVFGFPVDCRGRLGASEVPENYFGNCVVPRFSEEFSERTGTEKIVKCA